MLMEERQSRLQTLLAQRGMSDLESLSAELRVSQSTVRRDLDAMESHGLVRRTHGGVIWVGDRNNSTRPYAFDQRMAVQVDAKRAIARAASKLGKDGQTILLDGGTTTLQVAQHLPLDLRATVITNSPPIAVALAEHPEVDVILIGGRLYKRSLVTIGAVTVEELRMVRADICMLGVCSLHPQAGISVPDLEEAHVKRAMIAGAAEVVALASAEKLGTAAPYIVGPLSELTHLVTERSVPDEVLSAYRALGVTVVQG